ncbi:thiamine-phosphate kinase [Microcoleus sp. FACHB-1515]|uniref:thiamine-phosphate kinase n=1 Tax=Cyanophyceae TaxID=3028117 RepID=UPI001685D600|nr:thiamine-phosphate kinase [Microcoleus sp. FACHB-1515]MBD2092342.1 thiamine-phosphate kinase [Microcoleus sp. FACHB-1515]
MLQELGEQGLLALVQRFSPIDITGDDAALVDVEAGSIAITTDVLVDGVHFSEATTSAFDVGWRSIAANLSDLAAMGAMPLGVTVGLSLPGEVAIDWVEQLYQGMAACLQPYDTPILGGDLTRSTVKTVAITAIGQVDRDRAIRRSTAKPGDAILVTSVHGASRAGLELLLHPDCVELEPEVRSRLVQAHQRPMPRLDVLPLLPIDRIAGMDSSDGLADAVLQICRSSRVGAEVWRDRIPLSAWPNHDQAIEWALYGGEDFELVLCMAIDQAEALCRQLPEAAIVGRITSDRQVVLIGEGGRELLSFNSGFQHFTSH